MWSCWGPHTSSSSRSLEDSNGRPVAGSEEDVTVETNQVLLLAAAAVFLFLYLMRRRSRLKKEL